MTTKQFKLTARRKARQEAAYTKFKKQLSDDQRAPFEQRSFFTLPDQIKQKIMEQFG